MFAQNKNISESFSCSQSFDCTAWRELNAMDSNAPENKKTKENNQQLKTGLKMFML